jgi:hypothetical protein
LEAEEEKPVDAGAKDKQLALAYALKDSRVDRCLYLAAFLREGSPIFIAWNMSLSTWINYKRR